MIFVENKGSEIILANHQLIPVLYRFGIPLGSGDMSIADACHKYCIDPLFLIEMINAFTDHNYKPASELNNFPLSLILKYLHQTHIHYLEHKVPEMNNLILKLNNDDKDGLLKYGLIVEFFKEYCKELDNHIANEEDHIFPYIREIEQAWLQKKCPPSLKKKIQQTSISGFANTHSDVEEKIRDLKNIMIKYLLAPPDPCLYHRIINELFMLENDLNHHASIENNVLIPRVKEMEIQLLQWN